MGDYAAIRELVERYAVKVDPELHAEVLERYAKLDVRRTRASSARGSCRCCATTRSSTSASSIRTTSLRRCSSTRIATLSFRLELSADMNKLIAIVCLLTFLPLNGGARAQEAARSGPKAPKVILIIGDGMDQHQITIARDYLAGYRGRLTLDTLPVRSNVQIQTVAEEIRACRSTLPTPRIRRPPWPPAS